MLIRHVGTLDLVDALAVLRSGHLPSGSRDPQRFRDFIRQYCRDRSSEAVLPHQLSIEDLVKLSINQISLHVAMRSFCQLSFDARPRLRMCEVDESPPSESESRRIRRSFYRFGIFCNLFESKMLPGGEELRHPVDNRDIVHVFLASYRPWEVMELWCVVRFVRERVDEAFREIFHDAEENGSDEDDSDTAASVSTFGPSKIYPAGDSTSMQRTYQVLTVRSDVAYQSFCACQGLPFLGRLLRASNVAEKRALIQANDGTLFPEPDQLFSCFPSVMLSQDHGDQRQGDLLHFTDEQRLRLPQDVHLFIA